STPAAGSATQGGQGELSLSDSQASGEAEHAVEAVDLIWQLRSLLEPLLREKSQERVFYEIEAPLVPVLVDVEFDGVRVDARVLAEFAELLGKEMDGHDRAIYLLAGAKFKVKPPYELGESLLETPKVG